WPSHTFYKTTPQPTKIEDIRLQSNVPWIRTEGREYYLNSADQWLPVTQNNKNSPYAKPQLETKNWRWYLRWQETPGYNMLDLRARSDHNLRRIFSHLGNFTDNFVYDFDAEGSTIMISSLAGTTLYNQDGEMLKHFSQFSNSQVLRQSGEWHLKDQWGDYFSITDDLTIKASDSTAFDRQAQTNGWGAWYKDQVNQFFFRLHGQPRNMSKIISKNGRFTFDEIHQIIITRRSLWAVTDAGILRYDTSGKESLPSTDYLPCSISSPVKAVDLNPSELYFVWDNNVLNAGGNFVIKHRREIIRRLKQMEIKSQDREWNWRETDKTFTIQHREISGLTRYLSNGRFEDDQPLRLTIADDVICYKTSRRWYILDKETLKIKSYSDNYPGQCQGFVPETRYPWGEHRLEILNQRLYLNNRPYGPQSIKLNYLFEREGQFWALDDKFFYKINLTQQ
ncbi:MAG: hypothetical protein KAS32_20840, partial [Candidatus Peribacteraceae bacterium]|nr:hypothetical protein [Candidatus Peribacteraceae bacterium]